jgi:hypothetical protein
MLVVVKFLSLIALLSGFFYSSLASATTPEQAHANCEATMASWGTSGGNKTCELSEPEQSWNMWYNNHTAYVPHIWNELCPNGDLYINGRCGCPDGEIFSEAAYGCIPKPADCSTEEIGQVCGGVVCSGQYVGPYNCWLPPETTPQGCESGFKIQNTSCPAVCVGQQIENPITHHCDDPVCDPDQTLVDGSCYHTPICNIGYVPTFDGATGSMGCSFNQCPPGYVQGDVNGTITCAKGGSTTPGTVTPDPNDPPSTTVTQPPLDENGNPTGPTVITVNPGKQNISLDTAGLAQETTLQQIMSGKGKEKQGPGNGLFDDTIPAAAEDAAKGEFQQQLALVRSEFSQLTDVSLPNGGGSLPVINLGNIKGETIIIDMNRWADPLSWVAMTIEFAAIIIAFVIILG